MLIYRMGYQKGLGMKLSPEGRKIYKRIERKAKKMKGRGQGGHGLFSSLASALKGVVNVASKIATASNNFLKKFGFSNQDLITLLAYATGQPQFSPWIAGLRLAASALTKTDTDVEGALRQAKEAGATDAELQEMREALSAIAERIIRDRGGKDPPAGSLLSSLRSAKKEYVQNWVDQRQERRDDRIDEKLANFDAQVEKAKRRCKQGIQSDCRFVEDAPARRRKIQIGEGKFSKYGKTLAAIGAAITAALLAASAAKNQAQADKHFAEAERLQQKAQDSLSGKGGRGFAKKTKKFLKDNAVAIAGASTAILAGIIAYNKNHNADGAYDVKKKGLKPGFPVVINGITINTQAGLDEMSKIADKNKERDRAKAGEMFFGKTSGYKKQKGKGDEDRKSIKILCKAYPKLHPDCAKLVLRKIRNEGGVKQLGRGALSKIVNKSVDLYNKIMGHEKDPRDHVLDPDEAHAVFKNKKGALVRAQFAGPGTSIVNNIKRLNHKHKGNVKKMVHMDNFVSETDKIAMLHDLRYYIDGSDPKKVRHADKMMLKKLDESRKKGNSRFNVYPSKIGIKGKIILEDLGIFRPGSFAEGNAEKEVNAKNLRLMRKVKRRLEKEGYGQPKERPKRVIKKQSPWVAFIKEYAAEHKITYKVALKEGGAAYKKMKNKK